jgi:hypothetical protein
MLQEALEESRRQERTRLDWIESERERLELEMRKAQELVDRSHGNIRESTIVPTKNSKRFWKKKNSLS